MKQLQFSHREKVSIAFLSFIVLCLLIIQHFGKPSYPLDQETFKEYAVLDFKEKPKIDYNSYKKWDNKKTVKKESKYKKKNTYKSNNEYKSNNKREVTKSKQKLLSLKRFDPNKISEKDLLAMGIDDFFVKNLIKFRNAGAQFKSMKDIEKVYGLTYELSNLLPSYLTFTDVKKDTELSRTETKIRKDHEFPKEAAIPLDINTAQFKDFMRLDSITPKIAGRIINFRDKLGGFHSIDQIRQVYEIDKYLVDAWESKLTISKIEIETIDINYDSDEALVQHPYLNWKKVSILKKYRQNHGFIESKEDLSDVGIFSAAEIDALNPYIQYYSEISLVKEN